MDAKLNFNVGAINRLKRAEITALEKTGEALHTRIVQAQVIPFDSGNLQNESFFVDDSESQNGKIELVHSTPYARRLYYHPEYNFSTVENPNAKGRWFDDWLEGGTESEYAKQIYAKFYKKESNL
jgi:hypothetical protein